MNVYQVKPEGARHPRIFASLSLAIEEVRRLAATAARGVCITLAISEMTREEYQLLPEHKGY